MRPWVPLVLLTVACAAPDITNQYVIERALFKAEQRFQDYWEEGKPPDHRRLHEIAAEFEAVALATPEGSPAELRVLQGQAWLRAAECHFDLVDSGRAELILTRLIRSFEDMDEIFSEASLRIGRVAELHGEYPEAIRHYTNVFDRIEPDRRLGLRRTRELSPRPGVYTADRYVLELPLRAARLAARDETVTEGDYYAFALEYYTQKRVDPSDIIRVRAATLLADVFADQGEWNEASRVLDAVEHLVPDIMMSRLEPADIRLRSFRHQVEAWRFGVVSADSVRILLERLVADYPYGDYAPTALYETARCARELGRTAEAHDDIVRLVRDYPTAPVVPEAQLLRAHMFADERELGDARRILLALPLEFPTSAAALRAPLEIIAFYRNAGDRKGALNAIDRAESRYREVIQRYPRGTHSVATRINLVTILDMQGRYAESVDELLAMCEDIAPIPQRPSLLSSAAHRAESHFEDPGRAIQLYERLAEEFPHTRLGRAAVRHVHRLSAPNLN